MAEKISKWERERKAPTGTEIWGKDGTPETVKEIERTRDQRYRVMSGTCSLCDHDCCHFKATVDTKEHKLVKVQDMPGSFLTPHRGIPECEKVMTTPSHAYHEMRPKYPLKRVGRRGDGEWEQISWEQAYDEISEKLKELREKYGPQTLHVQVSGGTLLWEAYRFSFAFGSGNVDFGPRNCECPELAMQMITLGGFVGSTPDTPEDTKLMVLWATGHSVSSLIKWEVELKCPKWIVINPIESTKEATLIRDGEKDGMWLQIRPGADGALALAWLNVIINEELYDKDFVEKWTYGFDALKKRVQQYTPEWAEPLTWIPKEKIVESARLYATTKPAALLWGTCPGHNGNITQTEFARCCLRAITGNVFAKGGDRWGRNPMTRIYLTLLSHARFMTPEERKNTLGYNKYPVGLKAYELLPLQEGLPFFTPTFGEAVRAARTSLPYPVKAMITASNLLLSSPNSYQNLEALLSLELHVHMTAWWEPTAAIADYVLPATYSLERPDVTFLEHGQVIPAGDRLFPKTVPGKFDRRDDYDFYRELAIRLGFGHVFPWENNEEVMDDVFCRSGIGQSWDEFKSKTLWYDNPPDFKHYQKTKMYTPTGKAELYSTIFEKLGIDPLPHWQDAPESPYSTPALAKEYPLIITTGGKIKSKNNSWGHQVKELRDLHPDPIVHVHPDTAKKHDIKDGDWIWIESARGRVKMKCVYEDLIDPRVIRADNCMWYETADPKWPSLYGCFVSNINAIAPCPDLGECEPYMGVAIDNTYLVKIYKVKSEDEQPYCSRPELMERLEKIR